MLCLCGLVSVIVIFLVILSLYTKLTCGITRSSTHLVGKAVIVTGGNGGIGFATAKNLAERGAKVILACRSEARGTKARDEIIAQTGNADVHFRQMNLASFTSIRKFADDVLKTEKRLDILINNAGVLISENEKTEDGLSVGMQINYFGPFLLTNLLLPLLKATAPSRIINVSSMAYSIGNVDFDNLNMKQEGRFGWFRTYVNSKLCLVLMTVELDRQLRGSGVTVNFLHPGTVATSLTEQDKIWLKLLRPFIMLFLKNPWQGAQTSIHLAVAPDVSELSGRYFYNCFEKTIHQKGRDPKVARKLWEVSEKMVGLSGK